MYVYRVQTGTKYGTLFADDDADLAKLKTWFIDNIKLDLAEDSTLTDSVIDQTADNWEESFDLLTKTVSYDVTEQGLREALAGGYTAAGGNTVINKSMGLEAWD